MKFAIGAMTVGDILDRGVKLLVARFLTFYLINFVVFLPVLAFGIASPEIEKGMGPNPEARTNGLQNLIEAFLAPIASGACLHVVINEFTGRRVGFGAAMVYALRRLWALLFTGILVGILLVLGFSCCLVPGFIFLGRYAVSAPVVVAEGKVGSAAMHRSQQLLEGHRGRGIGLWLLVYFVIPFIIGLSVGLVTEFVIPPYEVVPFDDHAFEMFGDGGDLIRVNWVNVVIGETALFFARIFSYSFASITVALLYLDLRIRKEGYDLELAAGRPVEGTPALDLES